MAKRARQKTQHNTYNESIVVLDNYRKRRDNNHIFPRNPKQKIYDRALYNPAKNIVVSVGPAGTGKTLLAVTASIESLRKGNARKIVITRPAVSVDEQHGFLPGTLQQKMEPWTRPIFDVFEQYWAPSHIEAMVRENIIEIAPLAYMRGRTFKDCWIIADEMRSTKALLAGDSDKVSDIYRERVVARGFGSGAWGWGTAYQSKGKPARL